MAVAANSNSLVTAAEAAIILGLGVLTGDDLDNLQRQINAASNIIENWLQVPTIFRNVQEYHKGWTKNIYLRNYPVLSVHTIIDPAANTIPATDYIVENELGKLVHFGRFWVAQTTQGQPTRWKVDHVAGWWAGNREFTGSAGSGAFTVGNFIYVGASWSVATKRGCITKVAGTTAAPVITYCLMTDATEFVNADSVKEYTGTADGDGICTAGTPGIASYAPDEVKGACCTLVSMLNDASGASGVQSVGVGSLSVSYGGAGGGFSGDSTDAERMFMQTPLVAVFAKYRGNVAVPV